MADSIGFLGRLWLGLLLPWRMLFDGGLAHRVAQAAADAAPPAALPQAVPAAEKAPKCTDGLHLLALLQREGRLLDFLDEDVSTFSDGDVGAAARAVHEGCKRALSAVVELGPVRDEPEEARITLPAGFDPETVRLLGDVTGAPPYTGTLVHPGWRAKGFSLPTRTGDVDASILAPAEVEL